MLVIGDNLSGFPSGRVYALVLNMMRDRAERADIVAASDSLDELKAFESGERVEPYSDPGYSGFDGGSQTYRKAYRKGGPLEWYNPPDSMDHADPDFGHGVIVLEMKPRWVRVA
jgi:hypothetical protein